MVDFLAKIEPQPFYHLHIDLQWSHVVTLRDLRGFSLRVLQEHLYTAYSTPNTITGFDDRNLIVVFE